MILPIFLCLTYLASDAVGTPLIEHQWTDTAHKVSTGRQNYAVSSPVLAELKWSSVSVNRNTLLIYTQSCQTLQRSLSSLSMAEFELLGKAAGLTTDQTIRHRAADCSKPPQSASYIGGLVKGKLDNALDVERSELVSVSRLDETNYSLFINSFPNGLERVFELNRTLVLVYKDGRVHMTPIACLEHDPLKMAFLNQFRIDVYIAEEELRLFEQQSAPINAYIEGLSSKLNALAALLEGQHAKARGPRVEINRISSSMNEQHEQMKTLSTLMTLKLAELNRMRISLQEVLGTLNRMFARNLQGFL